MTALLLSTDEWSARRALLETPGAASLAALADGIRIDIDTVMGHPLYIPEQKALLTRAGGSCPHDGTLLEFDPFDSQRHRCGTCGRVQSGPAHDGFWRYRYHLWLAERAVHAAVLHRLRGEARHAQFALSVLEGYADRYAAYPNVDNTLGPSRVFFSTYLESIWLLQLCIALEALEGAGAVPTAAGTRLREHLVGPSRDVIELYDEGYSNRQVWNVAALMAASRILGEQSAIQRLVDAPSGLAALIANGCLADGSWYEGENYHMFAHRGLWYGVTIAEHAGAAISPALVARFDAGFIAPFLTALPDATLPSRRDSQYAISLRQPRFAEHCELGLARTDDPRLAGVAAMLYDAAPGVATGDNGRLRSSADVERNLPAMRLRRADLGWRTLLHGRAALPVSEAAPLRSIHLAGQGIAVFRRDAGRVYAALDYGETGGGHGHPDRLNLLLMTGDARWLDDLGTGSYVERSLHWYRSTLAHNAPLVNGRSQARVAGSLRAYDERGGAGWIRAGLDHAWPGVAVERTLVVMPGYIIDEVRWNADRPVTFDLPCHAPLEIGDHRGWQTAMLEGGDGLEDGYEFVEEAERASREAGTTVLLAGKQGDESMQVAIRTDVRWDLWRATAPGAPGRGAHRFHVVRAHGANGCITSVWSWPAGSIEVASTDAGISVRRADGTSQTHSRRDDSWNIELHAGSAHSSIVLGGGALDGGEVAGRVVPRITPMELAPVHALPLHARLGEDDYRRSESSWVDAGRPEASVTIDATIGRLDVEVHVVKRGPLVFVEDGQENPLDNEVVEINGDGVQVYVAAEGLGGAWTFVPVRGSGSARMRPVRGWEGLSVLETSWAETADGYVVRASIELPPGRRHPMAHVGVLVNETAPGRARRRGQLVLGGAAGEWVYLRGDRIDPVRLLAVRLRDDQLKF